jgi:triosephosphate isomerase
LELGISDLESFPRRRQFDFSERFINENEMMRKRYLVGNIKMNIDSPEEADQYLAVLHRESKGKEWKRTKLVIAPPFLHLDRFGRKFPKDVNLGAQNASSEKNGAYTGEVSVSMLKHEGVGFVIVGHSERRLYAKETDEDVSKKVRAVLKGSLAPVLCVGETAEERTDGSTVEVIRQQVLSAFQGISPLQAEKVIVAYEPRWAIGTDAVPTSAEILQARVLIVRTLAECFGAVVAEKISVLYGGSVKTALLDSVCFQAQMDGVLVGRESLFPYELIRMMDALDAYEAPRHGKAEGN